MVESIAEQVISGVIVAGALEFMHHRSSQSRTPQRIAIENDEAPTAQRSPALPRPQTESGVVFGTKMVLRLLFATVIGFFLAAFSAGVIESATQEQAEFGTVYSSLLIVIFTFMVWKLLSRKGPLRARNG